MVPGTTLSDVAVAVDFCSEESFQILVSTLSARYIKPCGGVVLVYVSYLLSPDIMIGVL